MTTASAPLHREVVLLRDLPAAGLRQGDLGTIVEVYPRAAAPDRASAAGAAPPGYEVEFFTASGRTRSVATLSDSDIRPIADSDILSVRSSDGVGR